MERATLEEEATDGGRGGSRWEPAGEVEGEQCEEEGWRASVARKANGWNAAREREHPRNAAQERASQECSTRCSMY
jgi:hypothetical protein